MIHINRDRIPRPKELDPENPSIANEIERAEKYFGYKEQKRGQHRFTFKAFDQPKIKEALNKLFHGKCAYCERKLEESSKTSKLGSADIEHYRPKSSVLESPDHPGYWWLASDWNNLLIACSNCNRRTRTKTGNFGKTNRFPLQDESKRVFSPKKSLDKESPLILNPCTDQPEEHLMYTNDGKVVSKTEKGKTSILLLGLNRQDLVEERYQVILQIEQSNKDLSALAKAKGKSIRGKSKQILDKLKAMTREEEEFAGLKRQYIQAILKKADRKITKQGPLRSTRSISNVEQKAVKKDYESFSKNVGNISIRESMDQNIDYVLQEHYVEKIELKNIKTFQDQSFDLTASEGNSAPWLMLLGENGTGKSTVLKSICMNLCDVNYFQNMCREGLLDSNSFIRHGTRKGTIKVWTTGNSKPRILEFKKNQIKFTNTDGEAVKIELPLGKKNKQSKIWQSPNFLLAYGATRLLPRGSKHEAEHIESQFSRLDNLFNPFVPLIDAERWLLGLNEIQFRRVAMVLKDLLQMSKNEEIPRTKSDVKIMVHGNSEPLKELSDGYQSVIALTVDILQLVMKRWRNPDDARAIVLLDEVGAHLHPRWKMRIVKSLRNAMPNIQFIVSTHQPLCLRGLEQDEVLLMRRDADKNIEIITDLPNPKELRISQILTSVFGLSSTMDPDLEAEFNRYFELQALHKRTKAEEEEMKSLRGILNPDLMLGETMLDTLSFNVVKKQYNSYKKEKKHDDVKKLTDDTLTAVQDLWNS